MKIIIFAGVAFALMMLAVVIGLNKSHTGSTVGKEEEKISSSYSFIDYDPPPKDISKEINMYLQDDTLELTGDMTLVQVDKIWGRPDEVDRKYVREDKEMYWEYGNFWASESKLKGLFYHKRVKFVNGKVSYWTKDGDIEIKTHSREDVFRSHLDEGTTLTKGMNKLEVYELWGLPASFEVRWWGGKEIKTRWAYKTNGSLSHYISFENNKVVRWGDY